MIYRRSLQKQKEMQRGFKNAKNQFADEEAALKVIEEILFQVKVIIKKNTAYYNLLSTMNCKIVNPDLQRISKKYGSLEDFFTDFKIVRTKLVGTFMLRLFKEIHNWVESPEFLEKLKRQIEGYYRSNRNLCNQNIVIIFNFLKNVIEKQNSIIINEIEAKAKEFEQIQLYQQKTKDNVILLTLFAEETKYRKKTEIVESEIVESELEVRIKFALLNQYRDLDIRKIDLVKSKLIAHSNEDLNKKVYDKQLSANKKIFRYVEQYKNAYNRHIKKIQRRESRGKEISHMLTEDIENQKEKIQRSKNDIKTSSSEKFSRFRANRIMNQSDALKRQKKTDDKIFRITKSKKSTSLSLLKQKKSKAKTQIKKQKAPFKRKLDKLKL